MNKKHTVIIAEDQTLFREMIISIIKEMQEFVVIAGLNNGEEVIDFIKKKEVLPYMCLLDIQISETDVMECAAWLKSEYPEMKVVLLTDIKTDSFMEKALSIGVDGYVLKESSLDQFKQLLRLIDDGQFIAPKFFVNHFSERLIGLQKLEKEGSIHTIRKRFQHQKDLHDRELRLIQCINRGWSNRMIAEELSISEGTVKNYISEMYKKLNISNRTELKQLLAKVTS